MAKIFRLSMILVLLAGCVPLSTPLDDLSITEQAWVETSDTPAGVIDIYFSDPGQKKNGDYQNGPDKYLVEAIDSARISVDVAVYNLNLWSVRDAILAAYHRGLQVRIVMESDNLTDEIPQELKKDGISIIGDRREGLMHNKFVILDRQDVWTGSMNFTIGSAYYDYNNLVHIQSKEIAENYLTEFDEMYIDDMFGDNTIANTPYSEMMVGSTRIDNYFSPDDGIASHLGELIGNAKESIYFMAYSFTADDLGAAIIEKSQQGIFVAGIMDADQIRSNTGSDFEPFLQAGITVRKDGNPGLMHNKVIVIDRKIVITGSYNFSRNAEFKNDENVIVIYSPDIAEKYLMEFEKINAESEN